ncbi:NPP1 family protein [Actinoplanes sp. NPDC051859]|uniref:NPP1 family protein n=1 Tax=Actinoplanes sp. NPDC051859 TaxID=3363909 RepID=UPI003790D141
MMDQLPVPTSPEEQLMALRTSRRAAADRPPGNRSFLRTVTVAGTALVLLLAASTPALAAPPMQLPGNAEAVESKWQPAYDYDPDGCYPTPAIGPSGEINGGLKPTGPLHGGCHDVSDLNNTNGYARHKCNNGWCAIAYALYFEKDQAVPYIPIGGHRHDWEHVVVWVHDDVAEYVATSAHGDFVIQPSSKVRWSGNHPKVVYHKDGLGTHAFRLANGGDEPPENASGAWQQPVLVGWNGYPSAGIRDTLSTYDFGSAHFGLKDSSFVGLITEAMPPGIAFDPAA